MEKDISNDLVRTHLIFDDDYSTTTMPAAITLSNVEQHLCSQVVWCIWHGKRSWKHQHKPYQVPLRWWAGRPALSHDILLTSLVMQWLPISQNMLPFLRILMTRLEKSIRILFNVRCANLFPQSFQFSFHLVAHSTNWLFEFWMGTKASLLSCFRLMLPQTYDFLKLTTFLFNLNQF